MSCAPSRIFSASTTSTRAMLTPPRWLMCLCAFQISRPTPRSFLEVSALPRLTRILSLPAAARALRFRLGYPNYMMPRGGQKTLRISTSTKRITSTRRPSTEFCGKGLWAKYLFRQSVVVLTCARIVRNYLKRGNRRKRAQRQMLTHATTEDSAVRCSEWRSGTATDLVRPPSKGFEDLASLLLVGRCRAHGRCFAIFWSRSLDRSGGGRPLAQCAPKR